MNILLVGPPGSGKTTLACTGRPPMLMIDVDQKAKQMQNLKPLIESGDLEIMNISAKLIEESLADRALNPDKPITKQPKGYIETVNILNDILDQKEPYVKYTTYILDSATRLGDHLKRLLIYLRGQKKFGGKADADMNWPAWGSYLADWEELFSAMVSYLPEGKDFICTIHESQIVERDPITEVEVVRAVRPMLHGQMREKLAGYFNEVYFLDVKMEKGKPIRRVRTQPTGKTCARTSASNFDEFEEPHLLKLLKKGGFI